MLRVGLTGGIGSGKSAVSERLAAHGAVVIDADKAARAVVEPGTPGLDQIAETFGPGVLRELDELESAIPLVRAPVLILADPQDRVVPFETARLLARALPSARLQLVQGAGHHLPRRAPGAVADAIVTFLASVEG